LLRISTAEFVAIMAMLVATVAISIDGLLPALSIITEELTPLRPNNAQIILSSFVAGMAIGTLIVGPLSDSYGRKPIIYGGAFIYILTSVVCVVSQSLELILVARFLQGVGASAPRVVAQALVRDFYKGREMARISSFIMIVFALVPAVAPLLGSFVMFAFDWRAIFFMFIAFVAISTTWMGLRINETVSKENRVKFNLRNLVSAFREILSNPLILTAVITLVFAYSILFVGIFLIQPVFERVFGRPETFPYWFAAIALLAASSSYVNARLVRRLGMRMLTNIAFRTQVGLSTIILLVFGLGYFDGEFGFFCFLFWMFSIFFQAGLTMGNLTALAMEPVGHIAGTAASLISAIATIGSVFLAAVVGQFFDGTPIAMIVGITLFASFGAVSAHQLKRYERGSEL
jgi:DHA1 family bicyclomycin/chloramphenicol resistance-like MFS transporter